MLDPARHFVLDPDGVVGTVWDRGDDDAESVKDQSLESAHDAELDVRWNVVKVVDEHDDLKVGAERILRD
jgi:hypothetical protein